MVSPLKPTMSPEVGIRPKAKEDQSELVHQPDDDFSDMLFHAPEEGM
jgi:hypothetical protein